MSITTSYNFTNDNTGMPVLEKISRTNRKCGGKVVLDTSYPNTSGAKGYDLSGICDHFGWLVDFQVTPDSGAALGYQYQFDYTNERLRVFMKAPPIVHEEVVTVTTNVGYLRWPAAFIQYVTDDADAFLVIPGGLTPVAKSVAVDMGINLTTGVFTKGKRTSLTFLAADTVTSCKVSYITQAWKDVTDNVVQACMTSGARTYGHADMAFAAAAPDIVTLGEDAVAIQNITWNNGGTITPMTPLVDDATEGAAATECVVDMRKATTFGEIGFNETDAVDTTDDVVYVTYIRDPGSGFLFNRFNETSITSA